MYVYMLLLSRSTGLANETEKNEGEVGLTVVEWGCGELASPLLDQYKD
jgi:hypothetical protein